MEKSKQGGGIRKGDLSNLNLRHHIQKAKVLAEKRSLHIDRENMEFVHPKGHPIGFWTNKPDKYREEANDE